MLEAVIFDMDGVLIDSEYSYAEAEIGMLHEMGHDITPEYHASFIGTSYMYTWTTMKKDLGLPEAPEYYIAMMKKRRAAIVQRDGIIPIPGGDRLVKDLKAAGVPIAVASSSPLDVIKKSLTAIGLYDFFDSITSGDEVTHSKPAPDVYLLAAERLGVDHQKCLAIEDSANGSVSVKSAQMVCIGYANPKLPKAELQADVVVSDLGVLDTAEVKEIFAKHC